MLKNKKGGIIIDSLIIISFILAIGTIYIYFFKLDLDEQKIEMMKNLEENYENKSIIIDYSSNNFSDGTKTMDSEVEM